MWHDHAWYSDVWLIMYTHIWYVYSCIAACKQCILYACMHEYTYVHVPAYIYVRTVYICIVYAHTVRTYRNTEHTHVTPSHAHTQSSRAERAPVYNSAAWCTCKSTVCAPTHAQGTEVFLTLHVHACMCMCMCRQLGVCDSGEDTK